MRTGNTAPRRRLKRRDTALTIAGALLAAALIFALGVPKFTFHGGGGSTVGSGDAAKQARSVGSFTGIVLAGDNNIIVRVGAKQSVVVHADSNLLRRVTTRVRSGRLVVATTPGNLVARSPMFVDVSVPSLDALELPGHGNISVAGVDTPRLTVRLPGAGNIEAAGTAARLDVAIDGDGTAQLRALAARDARAEIGGSGTIMLTATRSLIASVSGAGTILYGGDPPHLIQKVTGSGTIGAG
jgi:hypothetical protein